MRIERYLADDTRTAMALVRAELGPNAMILANRRVNGRVELTAAVDLEELIEAPRRASRAPTPARRVAAAPAAAAAPTNELQLKALERELMRLRGILEHELGDRSWRDTAGLSAPAAGLRQRLLRLGLSRSLVGELTDGLPPVRQLEHSWQLALRALAQRIALAGPSSAAVTAVMGSTGVGKTTSIAKLAGRDVQRFGVEGVGLVTLDSYRIGAQEQLGSFADALGLPLLPANDRHSLAMALRELRGRRVYIDTAGMAQHDQRLIQQLEILRAQELPVQTLVVLSASAQASQSRAIASLFAGAAVGGAIITKIDEALNLGGVLDVLVQARLPLHSVSDGQVVPDDLHAVNPEWLVQRAVKLMRGAEATPTRRVRADALSAS